MLYQNPQFKKLRQKLRNNATDAEKKLWSAIRKNQIIGLKFIRQYSVGRYVLDFYCPALRLAIELDGGQHLKPENKIYDKERTGFLNSENIAVVRFYDNDTLNNLEGVIEEIMREIKKFNKIIISPPPSPYIKGRD